MMWQLPRFLVPSYLVILLILVVVGCTSREDPSEVLEVCGNHSCGDLVMVTTDTSSEGFQYLDPSVSPDGTRILFSADWGAIPTTKDPGDELFVDYRQMIVMPFRVGLEPAEGLEEEGARLIRLKEMGLWIGGSTHTFQQNKIIDLRKESPIWETDSTVVFSFQTNAGYRLFRANISNLDLAPVEALYMERSDSLTATIYQIQHQDPALSPDGRWLLFVRSSCTIPDSFETCTQQRLYCLDMETAGGNSVNRAYYNATTFPLTEEYALIQNPAWSPDGQTIVFSGTLDVGGSFGVGTELYTIDFDTTGYPDVARDNGLDRLTYNTYREGDPISGIMNDEPVYSRDGGSIYFVSTRRAPSITLHDRSIWRIPANGSQEPEIFFFSRSDDWEPAIMPDGSLLFSSLMGFPTEMLDRLEIEAYERLAAENIDVPPADRKTEVQLRAEAADERDLLSFFEGVMSHLYIYR